MIRPTILFEGKEHLVTSAAWNEYGELTHASFEDDKGVRHVAFQKLSFEDEGYNGTLQLDLEKRLKWGEAVASGSHLD